MNILDSIQDAITIKDTCNKREHCYLCNFKGLCYNYFIEEPCNMEILKIASKLREVQRRDY